MTSSLMYQHRERRARVDVVDIDPYGTAAPFLDAAIGCVADGGEYWRDFAAAGELSDY